MKGFRISGTSGVGRIRPLAKFCVVTFFYFSTYFIANGQVPKMEDLVKVPPSPEAQAFAKYGNTNVNLYTGSPDISIPISGVKGREIEIPISLTYDASGIKVEQIATWVGLGWNLNVGGMVSRQVNGNPDDYLPTPVTHPPYFPFYSNDVKDKYEFVKGFTPGQGSPAPGDLTKYFDFLREAIGAVPSHKIEIQPDTYSFHALGISGTLVIDYPTSTAWCIEHPEIKAVPEFSDHGAIPIKNITGWTITDASGNVFYFQLTEETYTYDNNLNDDEKWFNSAWLLTKIESKNKRDVIEFNYGAKTQWEQPQLAGRGDMRIENTDPGFLGNDLNIPAIPPVYKISQSELSTIVVNGKKAAKFFSDSLADRRDLRGRRRLIEVQIFDQYNSIANRYKLTQSYFDEEEADEKKIRLKLDQVEIHGKSLSLVPQKYKFSYVAGQLPSRESFAQDFWGYYNGASNFETLIPTNYDYDHDKIDFTGADRKPKLNFSRIATMSSITYPTGGVTEFTYGLHRSIDPSFSYKEEVFLGGASIINDGNGLSEKCEPDNYNAPKIASIPLNITTAGDYRISISAPGIIDANTSYYTRFLIIYNTKTRSGNPFHVTPCQLINNTLDYQNDPDIEIAYVVRPNAGFTENITYQFSAGSYKLVVINSDPNVTINAEIKGVVEYTEYSVGGLRLLSTTDSDANGAVASKKIYYYNDLSSIPPSNISEGYLLNSNLPTAGVLQMAVNFEEAKFKDSYLILDVGPPVPVSVGLVYRYSNNRTQASNQITYSKVTEIQFSNDAVNSCNGYIVNEFANELENYVTGFSKSAVLNGKLVSRKVYNGQGSLLTSEENNYTKRILGSALGFYFFPLKEWPKDTYVIATPPNSATESFITQEPVFAYFSSNQTGGGGQAQWTEQHCNATGIFNGVQVYSIVSCYTLGAQYVKRQYLYPRYWITTDSIRTVQYTTLGPLETLTKNLYENTSHYQVTQVTQKDSKNTLQSTKLFYPHDMQALFPLDPIWASLISQNRVAEQVQKQTFKDTGLLSTERTLYKTVGTKIVPDILQFSTGGNALENRVQFSQYDAVGNPTEVSRINDVKTSVLYGYNLTLPVAQIKNASINQVFYTGFEANEEGGNSALNDSRTGHISKIGGYSKTLSGLSPSTNYILSYWQKLTGVWTFQSQSVSLNSTTSTYNITLSGQVDDVRFYPNNAQMSTFTYDVGVGITSMTDTNNISTYYEHDSFGRLVVVRDDKLNIIKAYTYNYFIGSQNGGQ